MEKFDPRPTVQDSARFQIPTMEFHGNVAVEAHAVWRRSGMKKTDFVVACIKFACDNAEVTP